MDEKFLTPLLVSTTCDHLYLSLHTDPNQIKASIFRIRLHLVFFSGRLKKRGGEWKKKIEVHLNYFFFLSFCLSDSELEGGCWPEVVFMPSRGEFVG